MTGEIIFLIIFVAAIIGISIWTFISAEKNRKAWEAVPRTEKELEEARFIATFCM